MDRASSCNVYLVQLETQCSFMVKFIHNIYQLYSVSGLIGPYSGASFKAVCAHWYVVIHVLLDASGRYGVVGRAAFFLQHRASSIEQYVYYHIPIRSYSFKSRS
jgi:hypothetical protein